MDDGGLDRDAKYKMKILDMRVVKKTREAGEYE